MGSGTILNEVRTAAKMLKEDWNIDSDVWSVTSINEVYREAKDCERWSTLHPEQKERTPYITEVMESFEGPRVIATDYMQSHSEQLRRFVSGTFKVLGTDGFGRSDTRPKLREFFEVDSRYVVVNALSALLEEGKVEASLVAEAISKYGINPDKPNPTTV